MVNGNAKAPDDGAFHSTFGVQCWMFDVHAFHPTVSESKFAPFEPVVLRAMLLAPAARATVMLTVFHVAHDPVAVKSSFGVTVTPLTTSASARLVVPPLA
jgi:hypothetical protein